MVYTEARHSLRELFLQGWGARSLAEALTLAELYEIANGLLAPAEPLLETQGAAMVEALSGEFASTPADLLHALQRCEARLQKVMRASKMYVNPSHAWLKCMITRLPPWLSTTRCSGSRGCWLTGPAASKSLVA